MTTIARKLAIASLCLIATQHPLTHAQTAPSGDLATSAREQRRQDERINTTRQQQERQTPVRGASTTEVLTDRLPTAEAPCFQMTQIRVEGDDGSFGWLRATAAGPDGNDDPLGRCLGTQGINLVLKRMQNGLVARGFITSRVGVVPQDLNKGTLVLSLTPGRIQTIRYGDDTVGGPSLFAALPARTGDVLNLRDIEQGLENFKRVPSADTDIAIAPAAQSGFSDLVVTRKQTSPFRGTVTLDDSGVRSTGKHQGGLTLAWDNPAGLNDLAYITLNRDLSGQGGARGTDAVIVHYAVPFGNWSASATYDQGSNRQTIAGAIQNYVYSGKSNNLDVRLSRLLHRNGNSKTTVNLGLFARESTNHIDDTEVEVQRRRVGGWTFGLDHRHYFGNATLDAGLSYRRGTDAFGAITAPEEAFGEGTSRFGIATANVQLSAPFEIAGRRYAYLGSLRGQQDHTRLAAPQQFAIGGRSTVRGFDGETVLSAERGWVLRNELSTGLGRWGIEAYLGADYGEVAGPSADLLIGKSLAGAVIGVRGNYKALRYDVFVGSPLSKPHGFETAPVSAGFELTYNF